MQENTKVCGTWVNEEAKARIPKRNPDGTPTEYDLSVVRDGPDFVVEGNPLGTAVICASYQGTIFAKLWFLR